jgi:hypothetical protein
MNPSIGTPDSCVVTQCRALGKRVTGLANGSAGSPDFTDHCYHDFSRPVFDIAVRGSRPPQFLACPIASFEAPCYVAHPGSALRGGKAL